MKTVLPLLAALAALSSCGPTDLTGGCSADTCGGCCDARGVCQPGDQAAACGPAGGACGACGTGQACVANTCAACTPKTCAQVGAACGQVSDGCGGVLECGDCAAGKACGVGGPNQCGTGTCTPKDCAALGATCGALSDGCSKLLACGTCTGATTCGGGGTPNVCGNGTCTPKTCAGLGKNCGVISDGCGHMLSCGDQCQGFATCGGGGEPNVCGALCAVSCPSGFACNAMGVCAGGNQAMLVLDEQGFEVAGNVSLNGALPARGAFCSTYPNAEMARVTFTDALRGYSATASIPCSSGTFAFSTVLPKGTYDVRVERGNDAMQAGVNLLPVRYQVRDALPVAGPTTGLQLDEQGFEVGGNVSINGAAPSRSAFCSTYPNAQTAVVRFTEKTKGYAVVASIPCSSGTYAFSTVVPPGTYEVRVERGNDATQAGTNLLPVPFVAREALPITGPTTGLQLDEQGFEVGGNVSINGAAPSRSAFCSTYPNAQTAVVRLLDKTKGYSVVASIPCSSGTYAFSTVVPPGTYEVRVERGNDATQAGTNLLPVPFVAREALPITGPTTGLQLDEQGFEVGGNVSINGAAPARGAFCSTYPNAQTAVVRFLDKTKGYSVVASIPCSSGTYAFSTVVPPGTYEVRVERGNDATQAGTNLLPVPFLAREALPITGPTTGLQLDEQGFEVGGNVSINGAAPSRSAFCSTYPNAQTAVVRFLDKTKGYSVVASIPCSSGTYAFSTLVPPGTYEVRVERGNDATQAGTNLMALSYLARPALPITGPTTGLQLDEQSREVRGTITVNGAPVTKGAFCSTYPNASIAEVRFTELQQSFGTTVSVPCAAQNLAFTASLPPGVYEVRVQRGNDANQAEVNLLPGSLMVVQRLEVK